MNRFSQYSFGLLATTTFILITGCQSVTNSPSLAMNEKLTIEQDTIDANTISNDWEIINTIVKKHDGEIVAMFPEPARINVDVCFYKRISQNGKHEIEQELSQATGKDIAIEISGRLYPPIGGLDESVFKNDPCVYENLSLHSQVIESSNPSNLNNLKTAPTIRIDWSKIDSGPNVLKDNRPRDIIYPRSTIDLAKAVNRPVADIYRHHTVYDSPEVQQVLDQIKTQLGDSYVDVYGNAEGMPKYFVVTRQNVAAESYEYVIKTGEAKGFTIDFEILPIADRNKKAMLDVYDSNEDRKLIEATVRKHGGELQTIGYTPIGFTLVVTVYFPNEDISDEKLRQLENELQHMTKANVKVEQGIIRNL